MLYLDLQCARANPRSHSRLYAFKCECPRDELTLPIGKSSLVNLRIEGHNTLLGRGQKSINSDIMFRDIDLIFVFIIYNFI